MNANGAPGLGHNSQIPTPEQIKDTLEMDYSDLWATADTLISDAGGLPPIADEQNLGQFTSIVAQLRAAIGEAESHRIREKSPWMVGERMIDAVFGGVKERMTKAMHGASRRVDAYMQAKLAAERAERARQARELEERARAEALAAERARKPEKIVEKQTQAGISAVQARDALEAARATPAAMTRERVAEGQLTTMREVGYVELVDVEAVDLESLRPYLAEDALLKAARAFAKLSNYKKQLKGFDIGLRDQTVIR